MTVTDTPTRPAPQVAPSQLRTDLEAALAYLDKHGWCKGYDQDDQGRVCLNGAIVYSCSGQVLRQGAMWKAVTAHLPADAVSGIQFNDLGSTTLPDIRALLVKAIEGA